MTRQYRSRPALLCALLCGFICVVLNTVLLIKADGRSKKSGIYAVPHLIDMLKSRKHRLWSAEVLRQITGQRLGANSAKEWRRWWEANKPADAE